MTFEFHENMVIWRWKNEAWNGVGFFGESRRGKTPVSFALAHLLFVSSVPQIVIFDDCFKIEGGRISQCRAWGTRDQFGEDYYSELADSMAARGNSIKDIEPGDHTFTLGKVAAYLLFLTDGAQTVKKERCSRMEFVEKLMPSNPFTWDYPKPGKDVLLQRFKENWMYFIIQRQRKTTKELLDTLAKEIFEDSKNLDSQLST